MLPPLAPCSAALTLVAGKQGSGNIDDVQEALGAMEGIPGGIEFDGFRFKSYSHLCETLDSATIAKYEDFDVAAGRPDKFGRQTVEVTACINVAEVLADRVDYGRFSGAVSEIDLEPVRPPPEWVGGPADGHEFRAAVAFFRAHHARRRAADPSLPERFLVLPYGLWSDGVQMSRWTERDGLASSLPVFNSQSHSLVLNSLSRSLVLNSLSRSLLLSCSIL